jgi:hypothetical protein
MHVPMNLEAMPHVMGDKKFSLNYADEPLNLDRSEFSLSFQSQRQLKSLRIYVDHCRSVLKEIDTDLRHFERNICDETMLSSIIKRLGSFCIDADSWGFHSFYDAAFRLQRLILESSGPVWSNGLQKALQLQMAKLFFLVEQCESNYRQRLVMNE